MILIITNTEDLTADFVVREITKRDLPFARLNTDEFPVNSLASVSYQPSSKPTKILTWSNRDRILNWDKITAVWYRRPTSPVIDEEVSDPGVKKFATDESYEFLRGLWYSLKCFWISHPDSIRRAEHKIVQLQEAQSCGFIIPRTVITNSPEEVQKFHATCKDGIVVKPLYIGFINQAGKSKHIYTTHLSANDLIDSDSIRYAPSIYQEYIPKSADIRVTVVGNRIFSAKIVAKDLSPRTPDWRSADLCKLNQTVHQLPLEEENKCIQLVRRLGLEFGAIDYALDRQNKYVFLEINPNGQWAWLESAIGARISEAIVDHLISNS